MSSGLRALMKLADDERLEFPISLYAGQMFISGRVCSRDWWVQVTTEAAHADRDTSIGYLGKKQQAAGRAQEIREQCGKVCDQVSRADALDQRSDDELTLFDASITPAVGVQGTTSGGTLVPIMRVPLASVSSWWIAGGRAFAGSGGGGGIGFGVSFDL